MIAVGARFAFFAVMLVWGGGIGCAATIAHEHNALRTHAVLEKTAERLRRMVGEPKDTSRLGLGEVKLVDLIEPKTDSADVAKAIKASLSEILGGWRMFDVVTVPPSSETGQAAYRLDVEVVGLQVRHVGWDPGLGSALLHWLLGYPGTWFHHARYEMGAKYRFVVVDQTSGTVMARRETERRTAFDALNFHERTRGFWNYLAIQVWPLPAFDTDWPEAIGNLFPNHVEPDIANLFADLAQHVAKRGLVLSWDFSSTDKTLLDKLNVFKASTSSWSATADKAPIVLDFHGNQDRATLRQFDEQLSLTIGTKRPGEFISRVDLNGHTIFPVTGQGENPDQIASALQRSRLRIYPTPVNFERPVKVKVRTSGGTECELVSSVRLE